MCRNKPGLFKTFSIIFGIIVRSWKLFDVLCSMLYLLRSQVNLEACMIGHKLVVLTEISKTYKETVEIEYSPK
jgi:hypothetical protein